MLESGAVDAQDSLEESWGQAAGRGDRERPLDERKSWFSRGGSQEVKFDLGNLRPALSSNSEETELLSIVNHIRGGPNWHEHTKKSLKTHQTYRPQIHAQVGSHRGVFVFNVQQAPVKRPSGIWFDCNLEHLNIGVWTVGTERAGRDGEAHIVRGASRDSGQARKGTRAASNERESGGKRARMGWQSWAGRGHGRGCGRRVTSARGRGRRVTSARGRGRRVMSSRAARSKHKSGGKRMLGRREASTRTARAGGIKREGGGNAREMRASSARAAGFRRRGRQASNTRAAGNEREGGEQRARGRGASSARAGGIEREGEGSERKGGGNEHEWRSPRERARPVRARVGNEHEGKSEGIGNERAGAGIDG
ncbi:hypothetical protein B0H14DRAFT_3588389 [Mycena olivaceomarginata]|nr:hypothetical protein B0H14DRAFT_3588389 [Mycena olivaceomarginata]